MNASIISTLAARTGTIVGGLTSVAANWMSRRIPVRAQWLQHEKNRRQLLYCDFIEEATKCYIDALQHGEADIPSLVGLYAKLSRMRGLSSKQVVCGADDIIRKILDTHQEPDKSFIELMANEGTIDFCTSSVWPAGKSSKRCKLGSSDNSLSRQLPLSASDLHRDCALGIFSGSRHGASARICETQPVRGMAWPDPVIDFAELDVAGLARD